MTLDLWDMHVHLDFMLDAREIARQAEESGMGLLAMTVTPQDYLDILPVLQDAPNVRVCAGLHPWWIADGRCDLNDAARLAEVIQNTRFVGEIGLDASEKHVPEGSLPLQEAAFETICRACARSSDPAGPKILSLHAVKAKGAALDILERTGCLDSCRCIFHWFTSSNEELSRAVKAGCMFSINQMMLRTRRGREYARQLPPNRILLETDLPPGRNIPFSAGQIRESLENALAELNQIRGTEMRGIICENSMRLLS